MANEYKRTYWLLFLGSGVLLAVGEVPAMLAGDLGVVTFVTVVGGSAMSYVAGRSLSDLEAASGPERADLRFGVVAVAFVLILLSTVVTLL